MEKLFDISEREKKIFQKEKNERFGEVLSLRSE